MSGPPPPLTPWAAVLDRLEADLVGARAVLEAGQVPDPAPWQPPAAPYDLPHDLPPALHARACALSRAQEQLAVDLAAAMARTRVLAHRTGREQALAQHVQAATTHATSPVYLDLEA